MGFPDSDRIVSPDAVRSHPKVFHLISLTPRILKLYFFISLSIGAHLSCSYIVRTFHVPSLKQNFGESNLICARSRPAHQGISSPSARTGYIFSGHLIQHIVVDLCAFTRVPSAVLALARVHNEVARLDPRKLLNGDEEQGSFVSLVSQSVSRSVYLILIVINVSQTRN